MSEKSEITIDPTEKVLAVTVAATKSYLHSWQQTINSISAAVTHYSSGHFIYASDDSKECKAAMEYAKGALPENWAIHHIVHKIPDDSSTNYKQEAQARIALIQGSCFAFARKIKADLCWNVESDIIVPPNALRNLEWVLDCPDSPYEIACLTYGNSEFLGGFGTKDNWIAEDFLPTERKLKDRIKLVMETCEKRLKELAKKKNEAIKQKLSAKELKQLEDTIQKEAKRSSRIQKHLKNYPPDGNIWEVISKHGWRRRGWLNSAYPALSQGCIVPVDWHGLGCILLNARALSLATFHGYGPECGSTQDLFLFWKRWYPNGVKAAMSTFSLCDHIKPEMVDGKRTGKYTHHLAYFEESGEYRGHLRLQHKEWCAL